MAPSTVVFVVGAPRSGTTLVQSLLGAHEHVATPQETDLFERYVAPWRRAWEEQLPDDPELWRRRRHKGLPAVLREQELDELLAAAVARVHQAALDLEPGATVLVDKVPSNALHGELILRYVPHARFLHVIRDGRDVVCSLLRAGDGWGREWAARTAVDAAVTWRGHVEAGRALARRTDAYAEVRFEELAGPDAAAALARLFSFCGVEASPEECRRIVAAHALRPGEPPRSSIVWGGEVVQRLGGAPQEPDGFAGEGGVGAWQRQLGARGRLVVEHKAGALLRELGYADAGWPGVAPLRRLVALGGLAAERARLRARRRLKEALQ
ncbi:MAG TPA: sulfotransferase [Gaiellaceae bacterium]|nr:sulfotransferase [Gaiellaceae bacterium]